MNTQQILQAMSNIQPNAQHSLPIIPNNGNPGGANNMPQTASSNPQSAVPANPLQWLEPSPAVANTNELLAEMANKLRTEMYNQSLSESKYRLLPHADGSVEAQLLTNTGDEFDPYNPERMLPRIPVDKYGSIEKNIVPTLPQGPQK